MTLARRLLWALNVLLAAAILIFTARYLAYPPRVDRLAGVDPDAALPSPPPKPGDPTDETVLLTLPNPLGVRRTAPRSPASAIALHGSLPTVNGAKGVAFVRTDRNVTLVLPLGEAVGGWRLLDLWKDRAVLESERGERFDVVLDGAIRR